MNESLTEPQAMNPNRSLARVPGGISWHGVLDRIHPADCGEVWIEYVKPTGAAEKARISPVCGRYR